MRHPLAVGCALLIAVCGHLEPPGAGASDRVKRAAGPVATTRLVAPGARDRDCADFARATDAQRQLALDPADPHRLDADDDGRACERLRR